MSPQEKWAHRMTTGPGPLGPNVEQRQFCANSASRRLRLKLGDIMDWGQRGDDPFFHQLIPAPQGGRKTRAVITQREK